MWRLLSANLRYRLPGAATAVAIGVFGAGIVSVILPIFGAVPSPEDDFDLSYFFPVFVLFAVLFAEFSAQLRDQKELRLLGHSQLPVGRWGVAAARAATPVVVVLAGLVLAELVMLAVQIATATPLAAFRFSFVAFFAAEFLVFIELPLLLHELRVSRDGGGWLRVGAGIVVASLVVVVLLRAAARLVALPAMLDAVVEVVNRLDPEHFAVSLVVGAVGMLIAFLNFLLTAHRRSMLP